MAAKALFLLAVALLGAGAAGEESATEASSGTTPSARRPPRYLSGLPEFYAFMESNQLASVAFVASWCQHSAKLRPEWEAAAEAIGGGPPALAFVEITDPRNIELKQRFNVDALPQVLTFRAGRLDRPSRHRGGRTAGELASYLRTQLEPALTRLESRAEAEAFLLARASARGSGGGDAPGEAAATLGGAETARTLSEGVRIIARLDTDDEAATESLAALAEDLRDTATFASLHVRGHLPPTLELYRPGQAEPARRRGDLDPSTVRAWVEARSLPPLLSLQSSPREQFKQAWESRRDKLILAVRGDEVELLREATGLAAAAEDTAETAAGGPLGRGPLDDAPVAGASAAPPPPHATLWVEDEAGAGRPLLEFLGVRSDDLPSAIWIAAGSETKLVEARVTAEGLRAAVERLRSGASPVLLRSAPARGPAPGRRSGARGGGAPAAGEDEGADREADEDEEGEEGEEDEEDEEAGENGGGGSDRLAEPAAAEVTASSFAQQVLAPGSPALVEVYSPRCARSAAARGAAGAAAARLARTGRVRAFRLDGLANDPPLPQLRVDAFPGYFFVDPAARRVARFKGEVAEEELVAFVLAELERGQGAGHDEL